MSDKPQPTPEQDAAVRRLLAEARVTEPMPDDVAERLDGVLADLASSPAEGPAAVAQLEARRRRRRAGALVLAAAAVVVAGVGVGQLVKGTSGDQEDAPASISEDQGGAVAGGADERGTAADNAPKGAGAEPEHDQPQMLKSQRASLGSLPVSQVSRQRFSADVRRVRAALPRPMPADGDFVRLRAGYAGESLDLAAREEWRCRGQRWGDGALVPVLFDGQPAVLAFRPATADSQVVDVLQCGSGQRLHTTTLAIRP